VHAAERGTRFDERTPGTGLGLSIVTDIASIYGGSLQLSRSELGGLRVEVMLPLSGSIASPV
jgi:signal transduction histidine kinase